MKTKLEELIEWMEDEYKSISKINREAPSAFLSITDDEDAVLRCLAKARELRDAEQKEPPYDREAFRQELILSMCGNPEMVNAENSVNTDAKLLMYQADAIITEYERRQGNG